MRRLRALAPAAAAVLVLTGCTGEQEPVVRSTAEQFAGALASGDGDRACALLAPLTRDELESSEEQPCAQAVLDLGLPEVDHVTGVHRHGRRGSAVLDGGSEHDTYFLAQFDGAWRIDAAGCTPRPELPYDCDLEGA